MDEKQDRPRLLAGRGSADPLAPQIELHALFVCPIFIGPYFSGFGRLC